MLCYLDEISIRLSPNHVIWWTTSPSWFFPTTILNTPKHNPVGIAKGMQNYLLVKIPHLNYTINSSMRTFFVRPRFVYANGNSWHNGCQLLLIDPENHPLSISLPTEVLSTIKVGISREAKLTVCQSTLVLRILNWLQFFREYEGLLADISIFLLKYYTIRTLIVNRS